MPVLDPAELLFATIGVSPVVNNAIPKITIGKLKEATEIPNRIDELARQIVNSGVKHSPIPREHDYKKLLDRLTKPLPISELEGIHNLFPPEETDLATPFQIFVQYAYKIVRDMFPVSVVLNYAGPKNIIPSADKVWKFYSQLSVINDPLRILGLIATGGLLRSQADAVRSLYPTISRYIDSALINAVGDKKMENEKFQLSPTAERGVSVWLGRRLVPYVSPEQRAKEAIPANNNVTNNKQATEDLQTVSQKSANI